MFGQEHPNIPQAIFTGHQHSAQWDNLGGPRRRVPVPLACTEGSIVFWDLVARAASLGYLLVLVVANIGV